MNLLYKNLEHSPTKLLGDIQIVDKWIVKSSLEMN